MYNCQANVALALKSELIKIKCLTKSFYAHYAVHVAVL